MNKNLELVRSYHEAFSFPQAEPGAGAHLSDMDVIMRQALLMDGGSEAFKAIKAGDMAEILAGLVDLAFYALSAIAMRGDDVVDRPVAWRHDGFVISIMRLLSDKINRCASGDADDYSEVYCVCVHLARGFLNADFDKAFAMIHDHNMARLKESGKSIYDEVGIIRRSKLSQNLDLSDCLYE